MTTPPLPPPPSYSPKSLEQQLHERPLPAPQPLPESDRDAKGRFVAGNPGKRKGARHRATVAVETLMQGQWETITQTVIQAALRGDMAAAKLVMERVSPPRRGALVTLDDFPAIGSVADIPVAHAAVLAAVTDGTISAEEAAPIGKMLTEYVTIAQATTLAEQIAEIKRRLDGGETTIDHNDES